MAYFTYRAEALDHPEWDNDTKKKHKGMALEHARAVTGAKKDRVTFSDREWEAIQKGAIAEDSLRTLLKNADKEDYTKRALPREDRKLSDAEITRIKNMFANGLEQKDIANTVGVSASTVSKILSGKE
jgi:DNA-directed RNA polymerase specialized sigma subunit